MPHSDPLPLSYHVSKSAEHVSRWIPLAKAVATVAILVGILTLVRHIEILVVWYTRWRPSGAPFLDSTSIRQLGSIVAAMLLVLGGFLVWFRLSAGRILLLIAVGWHVYSSLAMIVMLVTRFRGVRAQPMIQSTAMNFSIATLIYAILTCVVLLRRGIFK